jgi:ATP-dependent helicase/nuclease subunit B
MADRRRPAVRNIPAHRAFADALAAGLVAGYGRRGDRLALARGIVLLPNNRAVRAVRDAFVRASGGGLLLPRLVPVGDIDLDETLGSLLDPLGAEAPIPPAVPPLQRRMILARLVQDARAREGQPVDAGEAVRLAQALARTLDELLIERIDPHRLAALDVEPELSGHWQTSLALFRILLDAWPRELARIGCIDLADRRNRLLDRAARGWRNRPPPGFVVAAGISTPAPAVAALLRTVAMLPRGRVVLADLDLGLDDAAWRSLGPHDPDPVTGRRPRGLETHPQYELKLLLDRMGIAREEVKLWRWGSEHDARARRGRAIGLAMLPPLLTGRWRSARGEDRTLAGVAALEAPNSNAEAQAIAIALREALETPGRTAALVTPDRGLAARVASHLRRWGIEADDSAGRPLARLAPGTLLIGLAQAAVQRFAPVPLLSVLKHPLVRAGAGRLGWLDEVRALDLALRGPRPAPGLAGIDALVKAPLARWWHEDARPLLAPLEAAFGDEADPPIPLLVEALREVAGRISDDAVWAGHQGHAAARLFAELEGAAPHGPARADGESFVALLGRLLADCAVRPPQGGHPRVAILGLIEARLQQADLMILAGLNEGVWPALPQPDPWLAPRVRQELGLASLERRIGQAARDLANGLGASRVLLTRARRDEGAPTVASRFWLRLRAMAGPRWTLDTRLAALAEAIDRPEAGAIAAARVSRPAPVPPAEHRPRRIAVTDVDRLRADPYAFYAKRVLGLRSLDPVDADPSAAWRGTAVHDVLEDWWREDGGDPARLLARADALLDAPGRHPLLRVLWRPRLRAALEWIAQTLAADIAEGRVPVAAEVEGEIEIAGVRLHGKADRIDRVGGREIAIVDYKSGKPPSLRMVEAGHALQLGLLGLIAECGGFRDLPVPDPRATAFEYWSLGKKSDRFGYREGLADPKRRGAFAPDALVPMIARFFEEAVAAYLTGTAPFTARPHPDAPVYADYDQLMRLDEWYGRGES